MVQPQILRDKVKCYLLKQLKAGKLQIGKTINLAAVAREIGTSVTPVREALSQLEHARIVKAIPNRGFVIQPLRAKEARHLYETLAQLEVMALENTAFTSKSIEALQVFFNGNFHSLHTSSNFHEHLIQDCNNPILIQILNDIKARLFFYEQMLPENENVDRQMGTQNKAILEAIVEDNLPTANLILKMHWMSILERVQGQFTEDLF